MNGKMNSQNVRQYIPKVQKDTHLLNYDTRDSQARLTVWAALCGNGLILGPYTSSTRMLTELPILKCSINLFCLQLAEHFNKHYFRGLSLLKMKLLLIDLLQLVIAMRLAITMQCDFFEGTYLG